MKKVKQHFAISYTQSVTKATEGGIGVATLRQVFPKTKDAFIEFFSSCYVGQTAFTIFARNKQALRKAGKVLKDYGYIRTLNELRYGEGKVDFSKTITTK